MERKKKKMKNYLSSKISISNSICFQGTSN
jgi:hypothetical protein